jgi:hypothetical protein
VPRRSIVRDGLFEDSLEMLFRRDAEAADEYTAAAEDLLSREPQSGTKVEDGVWILPMAPIGKKHVYLYYTFDEMTVLFLAIVAFDS